MEKDGAARISIRTVVLLTLLVTIAVSGGLAGYFSLHNGEKAVGMLARQLHEQQTERVRSYLSSYLTQPHLINQITLDAMRSGILDPQDLDAMRRHIWQQTQTFTITNAITFARADAEAIGTARTAPGEPIVLGLSGADTGYTMQVRTTDAAGMPGAITASYPDYDPRERPWYQAAVQRGGPTWTPVFMWTNGAIGADAVVPVRGAAGELLGVYDVSLTLEGISLFLREMMAGAPGQVLIVERSGLLIASSGDEPLSVEVDGERQRRSAFQSTDPQTQAIATVLTTTYGDLGAIDGSAQLAFEQQGERQLMQVTPFQDPYGLDWLIVVVTPESSVLGPVLETTRTTLLLILFSLLVTAAAATLATRQITQPLLRLNEAAQSLAQGRWEQPDVASGIREVDELGHAFQQMSGQLSDLFAALQSKERWLHETLEAASMGIWERDLITQKLLWSDQVAPLFGVPQGQAPATYEAYLDLIFAEDRELAIQLVEDSIISGADSYETEYRVIWPDGSTHWLRCTGRIDRADDGTPLRTRGIIAEITTHKRLQHDLMQAQKLEAVGRLAGGIAHDFNNILTVMLTTCSFVLEDMALDDPLRSEIEIIRDSATRAAVMTRQLLTLSRRQLLRPEALSLNDVIGGLLMLLRRLLREDIQLDLRLNHDLGYVLIDRGQIEQVLMNLVVNARDAMPNGGTLAISTLMAQDRSTRQGCVVVEVQDSGLGMEDVVRERIFEPFFTTKEHGQGTGLGLATVHGIVIQSGGSIDVCSELGRGSCFTIRLPEVPPPAPSVPPTVIDVAPCHSGGVILLVEDEPWVRDRVSQILQKEGYQMLIAERSQEALGIIENLEQPLDLLLTDIVMPGGMRGYDLAARALQLRPDARILLMSGYPDSVTPLNLSQRNLTMLYKPFTPELLLQRVAELLGAAEAHDTNGT